MKNGEILFLYDANLTNPNGDPDDENRPRMDYQARRNLVSDVRLKRYIRDYLQERGGQIYVENPKDGNVVDATTRIKNLLGHNPTTADIESVKNSLIDVRLFGATIPIKKGEGGTSGDSIKITGPVQFTWGYSLNEVDMVDSYSITSRFSSGEGKKQGTIGKDYRIYYSFIGFYGIISGYRAENSGMSEQDINHLDECMVKAIPQQATRSKIGQFPRLYLRIQYLDRETTIGDLREDIALKNTKQLRTIEDVTLEIEPLFTKISSHKSSIEKVIYWHDPKLKLAVNGSPTQMSKLLDEAGIQGEKINA